MITKAIRQARERANKKDYSNMCGDCLRHRSKCLARIFKSGVRCCAYCKKLEPLSDFTCMAYYSKTCQKIYRQERAARAGNYTIECSYCGEPISKGPFCNESCRQGFEKVIVESING